MSSFSTEITLWGDGQLRLAPEDWRGLIDRLGLQLPAGFPWPTGDLQLHAAIKLQAGTAGLAFQLHCQASGPPPLGNGFCGFALGGPLKATLTLDLGTADEAEAFLTAFQTSPTDSLRASGELTLEMPVRLPTPPEWDILQIDGGDGEGWINLRLSAAFAKATGSQKLTLKAEVTNLFSAKVHLPGAIRGAACLALDVTNVTAGLEWKDDQVSATLSVQGKASAFVDAKHLVTPHTTALAPIVDLLTGLSPTTAGIAGKFTGTLLLNAEAPGAAFHCNFPDTKVQVSLMDLLAYTRATHNGQPPPAKPTASPTGASSEDLLSLALSSATVRISGEPLIALGFTGKLPGLGEDLPDLELPAFISVGYRKITGFEFGLGLGQADPGDDAPTGIFRLPLSVPKIDTAALKPLAEIFGQRLHGNGRTRYDEIIGKYFAAIEAAVGVIEAANSAMVARPTSAGWVIEPQAGAVKPTKGQPVVFAAGRTADSGEFALAYNLGDGWQPLVIKPAVQFERFTLVFPMQNPRDIRVSGTMRLSCEGPFAAISHLPVTVGLSVDLIFASVTSEGGLSIEVPPLLPGYDKGRITIGQCRIGFGYTKSSFTFAFAGECVLPRQLVDDVDTEERFGFGLRLPEKSNLAVRFDIIPLVLGNYVVPLPMLQLNCDLRRDAAHSLVQDRRTCTPGWDGLQLVAPGKLRVGFERFSYNLFLGPLAYSNSDFAGDIQLGDEVTGFTACLDNGYWAYGLDSFCAMAVYPIASIPFFDDACLSLRAGGFALGFDLQRPFPSFSPMALFEILALVSDPANYPVPPRGPLADMIRVSLIEARLALPPRVTALFPLIATLPQPPRDATINLGTFITVLQVIGRAAGPVLEQAVAATRRVNDGARAGTGALSASWHDTIAGLAGKGLLPFVFELAEALPPTMRQFNYAADFLGFHGQACLGFVSRAELFDAINPEPAPAPAALPAITPAMAWDATALKNFQPRSNGGQPLVAAPDPQAWLRTATLAGNTPGFQGITDDDVREIPLPDPAPRFEAADITDRLIRWLQWDRGLLATRLRDYFNNGTEKSSLTRKRHAPDHSDRKVIAAALTQALTDKDIFEPRRQKRPAWLQARFPDEQLKGDVLRKHNRLLLEIELPQLFSPAPGGLMCAATLHIFSAEFALLGWVDSNADFALVARGKISEPWLPIPGCLKTMPLTLTGRAYLRRETIQGPVTGTPSWDPSRFSGLSRLRGMLPQGPATRFGPAGTDPVPRSRTVAVLELQAHADAQLVAGLLHVRIGRPDDPVRFRLQSDGQFSAAGDGQVKLLGDLVVLDGKVEASRERLFARGDLTAFGALAADATIELLPSSLNLSAKLEAVSWGIGFSAQCEVQANPGATQPHFEGTCALRATTLNLQFDGRCSWTAGPGGLGQLKLEGRPQWAGRSWAQGSFAWEGPSARLQMRDTVQLSLKEILRALSQPPNQPDLVAKWFTSPQGGLLGLPFTDLRLDLDLRVILRKESATDSLQADLSCRWTVALQLAGAADYHPLATNEISLGLAVPGLMALPIPIVDLSSVPVFPLGTLSIPAPNFTAAKTTTVRLATTTPPLPGEFKVLQFKLGDDWFPPLPSLPGFDQGPVITRQEEIAITPAHIAEISLPQLGLPLKIDLRWQGGVLGLLFDAGSSVGTIFLRPGPGP